MAKVPTSERTRNELKKIFSGKRSADRSGLIRQAVRLIVEETLEAEAGHELGRGYYEHGAGERSHLKLPITHRRMTRTTNRLERGFGEERRRTKVMCASFCASVRC